MESLRGSIVAIATPMHSDGEVDETALSRFVEFQISQGTNGIIAAGTTGECSTLTAEEHLRVIEVIVDATQGRVPVIAGTGSNSTAEAIEMTRAAERLGANASLLIAPYYNRPSQEGLYQHYRAIAEAVPLPHVLYNAPIRTACDISNATVFRLAEIENIVGIKDATGDVARGEELVEGGGDLIRIFSGDDATAVALLKAGAQGSMSVTANIAPSLINMICQAALAGDFEQAESLDSRLLELHQLLFLESNPIPVKFALAEQGKMNNFLRLPLTPLNIRYHDELRSALHRAGLSDVSS